jgi:molecular chaperone GrpE
MEKDQNLNNKEIKKEEENSTKKTQVEENKKKQDKTKKDLSREEKILELEDKLTRTLAEMENQRRRFEKEKDDAFEYGGFSFARESLNLIDNLERAKQSLENDETLKDSNILKKTLEHFDIIKKDLISIFKKNNVEEIDSFNKKLNPNFHQAMIEIENNEKEPGTIIQEIQKGFTMKGRLLRPSLVGVSKKSSKENENEVKNEKSEENQENSNPK